MSDAKSSAVAVAPMKFVGRLSGVDEARRWRGILNGRSACPIANWPTLRPTLTPVSIAKRKWKPASTRDSAFSSSASLNESQHRSVPGGAEVVETMQNGKTLLPVNLRRISAAVPPSRLCVDG